MEPIQYTPYESVEFKWLDSEQSLLSIKAPWMTLEVDIDKESIPLVSALVDKTNYPKTEMSALLANISEFPLLDVEPRQCLESIEKQYISKCDYLHDLAGPRAHLEKVAELYDIEPPRELEGVAGQWTWDVGRVLEYAQIPGTDFYDPFSVYTRIRELRLQHQIEKQPEAEALLEYLEKTMQTNEPLFFDNMTDVLSQQYYVTKECCDCLEPALVSHSMIADQIKAYIQEEINHDQLILKSINALSEKDSEDLMFMPGVKLEIALIKEAAKECAVGFSALVSIMEGTVYPDIDPVGGLLKNSSLPDSANGVEAHFQINKNENHTAIPEQFVAALPPIDRTTVISAMRYTESTIAIDAALMGALHRKFTAERQ